MQKKMSDSENEDSTDLRIYPLEPKNGLLFINYNKKVINLLIHVFVSCTFMITFKIWSGFIISITCIRIYLDFNSHKSFMITSPFWE